MSETISTTQEVWEVFRERLKRFVLARVPDPNDAEDILQEVFVKIHTRLHTLQAQEKLEAWVYQITRNALAEHYRRGLKTKETLEVPEDVIDAALAAEAAQEVADHQDREAENLIHSCLAPMLEALPSPAREAILLTEYEGLTQQQMAERLGLSLSGAKSRVQRARERLKAVLLECCHLEFDRRGNIIDYERRTSDCQFCCGD